MAAADHQAALKRLEILVGEWGIELWTLEGTKADFSVLPFLQRYEGRFEDGGSRIAGQWMKADAGCNWETDFELSHSRA